MRRVVLRVQSWTLGLGLLAVAPGLGAQAVSGVTRSTPVAGASVVSTDDASAIFLNPANLPWAPGAELAWRWFRPVDAKVSQIEESHSIGLVLPVWKFGAGLAVDIHDDSPAQAIVAPHTWTRLSLAMAPSEAGSLGIGLGWSNSDDAILNDLFSVTLATTARPSPYIGFSFVARDLNEPSNDAGLVVPRSYDMGVSVRPVHGRRAFEVGAEATYEAGAASWSPRGLVGFDVPSVGRVRADVTWLNAGQRDDFVVMSGLDVPVGVARLSGGGAVGTGITGGAFTVGAALRSFREPGPELPAKVVRFELNETPGVRGHLSLLRRMWQWSEDPEVEGVVLVLRDSPADSMAHGEEIGDAIRLLRHRGKKVMCHLEDAGGGELFACAQADRIVMNPAGGLRFSGMSSSYMYFADLLTKLGIQADFVRIGEHKTAAEQFTRSSGTEVARSDHQDLLRQYESVFLHDVGGGRRIAKQSLADRLATGPFIAPEARDAGLVDALVYEDELERAAKEMMGGSVSFQDGDDEPPGPAPERWGVLPRVAVIYLAGDMIDGESQTIPLLGVRLAGSRTITEALRQADEDPSVKAIVFRIETGGGSSLAADVILRQAQQVAKNKPLIVSMGSRAASGGYYASMAGKSIFANRSTLTGSIGIFYGKVDVSGLLSKVGIGMDLLRTSPRADAESLYRPFTDDERQVLAQKVKQFYDLFVGRVAEGRNMTMDAVDAVARGRVWSGAQAKDNGLVDQLGGFRQALAEARRLGELPPDAPLVVWPEEDDSLLGLVLKLAGLQAGNEAAALTSLIPPELLSAAGRLVPLLRTSGAAPLAISELPEHRFERRKRSPRMMP